MEAGFNGDRTGLKLTGEFSADISSPPGPPVDAAVARVASRLSSEYFLRSLLLIAPLTDNDFLTSVVSLAIIGANTAHLDQDLPQGAKYGSLEDVPPDEVRKPVSVMAVAETLGIPYETARRHVNKLLKAGRCERLGGGVIVPRRAIDDPVRDAAMLSNLVNLRRLFRGLKRAGLDLE